MPAARVADDKNLGGKTWHPQLQVAPATSQISKERSCGRVWGAPRFWRVQNSWLIIDHRPVLWTMKAEWFTVNWAVWRMRIEVIKFVYAWLIICMYLMQRELNGSILDANRAQFSEYKTWIWNIGSTQLVQKPTAPGQCCNARYKHRTIIHYACLFLRGGIWQASC